MATTATTAITSVALTTVAVTTRNNSISNYVPAAAEGRRTAGLVDEELAGLEDELVGGAT